MIIMEIIYLFIGMFLTVITLAIAFFLTGFLGVYSLINKLNHNKDNISISDKIAITGNNTRKYISNLFSNLYYLY